jgi:hypothetical protein
LELGRKEPIIAAHDNAGWNDRPRLEDAGRSKHRIRLAWFTPRKGLVNYRLRYVVEKVDKGIEQRVGVATIAYILLPFRLTMASIPPPITGVSPGFGIIALTSTSIAT